MVEVKGFEPRGKNMQVIEGQVIRDSKGQPRAAIDAHGFDTLCPELARVVNSWAKLPKHVRQTVSTIIEAHT